MKKFSYITLIFVSLLIFNNLEAVPSYAKNVGMDCSTCHTAYPQLTQFGKVFLETAGDLLIQEDYGMVSMTPYPFSARFNFRPIDKSFSKDSTTSLSRKDRLLKMRSLHEGEIFISGRIGDVFLFTEFEAEDEWCDDDRPGFDVRLTEGYAIWDVCDDFHIFAGYTSPFIVDANDTVHHHKVLRRQWKAASYVPDTSQMLGVHIKKYDFNWIVAWHADDELCEGEDPRSLSFRTYYDWCDHTFGGYFTYGNHFDEDSHKSKHDYYLYGLDAHFRFNDTNIMMLLGFRDEFHQKTDFDFSVEANRIYPIECGCLSRYFTTLIPIVNLDVFVDRAKSSGTWLQGSAGVAFYINPEICYHASL